jgi:hypothetical protein
MKTSTILSIVVLTAFAPHFLSIAAAQGSLTPPPGAPAPVYKTLNQVEARTPLTAGQPGVSINASGTITISQRGSYYLTGNLTITAAGSHGIHITADQVSLDLNGFSLVHTTGSGGSAIMCDNRLDTRISNGSIVGGTTVGGATFTPAGWDRGVSAMDSTSTRVSDLTVRGTRTDGIQAYQRGSTVERCTVHTCGGFGIYAQSVHGCTVRSAGSVGISTGTLANAAHITDSFAETLATGVVGIYCLSGTVSNSQGYAVNQAGIEAETVTGCRGVSPDGTGILAVMAVNSTGISNLSIGLQAETATGCYGRSISGTGMSVSGTATSCRGSRPGGTAINAGIAVACTVPAGGGTITSAQKHLGTP